MQAISIRIFLILFLLILINPASLPAAAEQRTALVIGNSAYSAGPLKNPVNDATDMATMLKKLGFSVTLNKNASLQQMEEAIEAFGNRLKRGGVGLFYYAGHGVQVNGTNYLLPIGAKINKEADVKYQAVDANKILDEMATANNGLNIVMLDACRDNPYGRSFRNASRGLAIVSSAPSGTFISYSTSPGNVARDGDGRNSPYTQALLENMDKPGLSINNIFMQVRSKMKRETGQIPWELSSLEGDFYFVPVLASKSTAMIPSGKSEMDALDEESRKLEKENRSLVEENALLEKKKALGEKRQKIEEEKVALDAKKSSTLAMGDRPPVDTATEIDRDGRFIAYSDGTALDTWTNLMWAANDNGAFINWSDATSYCANYRGGGYKDWRIPTKNELFRLYAPWLGVRGHQKTELIKLTGYSLWASETRGADAITFDFFTGEWHEYPMLHTISRALPVRTGKSVSKVKEIKRDGRFIAYDNGTVLDTRTKLMWAAIANSYLDYDVATNYCNSYGGGGYTDWRMPKQNELAKLYDARKTNPVAGEYTMKVHLTEFIVLTDCCLWPLEQKDSDKAIYFDFSKGKWYWDDVRSGWSSARHSALPVRSVK